MGYPLYDHPDITTFHDLVSLHAQDNPTGIAFQYSAGGQVVSVTFRQFQQDIASLCAYFHQQDLPHAPIALIGENSYAWILAYFAIVESGHVVVPIDKELSDEDIRVMLREADAGALVYDVSYSDVAEQFSHDAGSRYLFCLEDFPKRIKEEGERLPQDTPEGSDGGDGSHAVCAILFTSGTTGKPKGVMLTQRSIVLDAVNACRNVKVFGPSVLTLPLHHTFAFTVGVLAELIYGYPVFISKSLRYFQKDMRTAQPENMILVPLYVETMYRNIWKAAREKGKERQLRWLIGISNGLRKVGIDRRKKWFSSVTQAFGGKLEIIICGGASLDQTYIDGMEALGITVLNGYGITECSPVLAVNRNDQRKPGSVGLPLPGCEIRVVDGEIWAKGSPVMQGYYRDEAATRQVLRDGWFQTGDLGYMDEDGFLFITGRKKNLIILSNGKNVSPEELEDRIRKIDGVQEVIVREESGRIAAEIYAENPAGIEEGILALNRRLPNYKRIQDIRFRKAPFEKTTTQKIQRI